MWRRLFGAPGLGLAPGHLPPEADLDHLRGQVLDDVGTNFREHFEFGGDRRRRRAGRSEGLSRKVIRLKTALARQW
eukprot:3707010-Pyramimonas_sp.AAC.1